MKVITLPEKPAAPPRKKYTFAEVQKREGIYLPLYDTSGPRRTDVYIINVGGAILWFYPADKTLVTPVGNWDNAVFYSEDDKKVVFDIM